MEHDHESSNHNSIAGHKYQYPTVTEIKTTREPIGFDDFGKFAPPLPRIAGGSPELDLEAEYGGGCIIEFAKKLVESEVELAEVVDLTEYRESRNGHRST